MSEAAIVLLRRPDASAAGPDRPSAFGRPVGLWSLLLAAVFAASAALSFAAVVILGSPLTPADPAPSGVVVAAAALH